MRWRLPLPPGSVESPSTRRWCPRAPRPGSRIGLRSTAKRVLTTRDSYFLDEVPEHIVVIGSGVTGVEFTHIFESLGAKVSLVVSRQQILPYRDAEVAAVLEEDFLERGVRLVIGARAENIEVSDDGVSVICNDGRVISGSHALAGSRLLPANRGSRSRRGRDRVRRGIHHRRRYPTQFGPTHLCGRRRHRADAT